MRDDDAADAARAVVPALLDHGPDALAEVVFERGQGLLADLDLGAVGDGEDVFDELGDGVFAEPEELRLAVVDQIEAVGHDERGGEAEWGGEDDVSCVVVGETCVGGHVVQGVEFRVDVLDKQRERKG